MRCCWTRSRHSFGKVSKLVCTSPHITARLGGGRGEGEEGVKGSYRERGRSGAERVERKEGKEKGEKKAPLLMDIDRIWEYKVSHCTCLSPWRQAGVCLGSYIAPVWVVVKTKFGASC